MGTVPSGLVIFHPLILRDEGMRSTNQVQSYRFCAAEENLVCTTAQGSSPLQVQYLRPRRSICQ